MFIILPVVLYGCETWSFILRVFENRVPKRILGPKRKWQDAGEDGTMSSLIMYALPNIRVIKSKRMRWAGPVVLMGDEKCIQNFDQKT
jgi:hypothetical protein